MRYSPEDHDLNFNRRENHKMSRICRVLRHNLFPDSLNAKLGWTFCLIDLCSVINDNLKKTANFLKVLLLLLLLLLLSLVLK
jgi:hypothetical protein